LLIEISFVVVLTIINGLLSMSELAVVSSRPARLRMLQDQGSRGASMALRLAEHPGRFLSTVQIGITLVGVLSGAFSGATLGARLSEWLQEQGLSNTLSDTLGVGSVVMAITYLSLIIGELVPKQIALRDPEKVAARVAPAMVLLSKISLPLVWLLDGSGRFVLRLLGQKGASEEKMTEEEVKTVIAEARTAGVLEHEERNMLVGLLDLGDLGVEDVMVHRTKMRTINADLGPEGVVAEVLASPYTRMPIWRGSSENIIGVLHAKDLLRALDAAGGDATRLDVEAIAFSPWFVPVTTSLHDQLKAFLAKKTHFALAVDEYGEVMGLVTLEDILEEIVGDIRDEHDLAVAGLRQQPDGSVLVDGSVPIRDLNRAMEWSLPDEEATTIAGLVIHEAQTIPEAGQAFNFHGFRFEVMRKTRNRVTSLRIRKTGAKEPGQERNSANVGKSPTAKPDAATGA
jgi:Mg2+/Co2+ transporter CorB